MSECECDRSLFSNRKIKIKIKYIILLKTNKTKKNRFEQK